ncbi:hypothetical protein E4U46_001295 [Claviceps purpurea]|nr:hypothetical protein E4U46_001295 [Claviceps purpurea]
MGASNASIMFSSIFRIKETRVERSKEKPQYTGAVANDAQASFILIKGPELLNKYVGESDEQLRDLFERARSSKPCIVFFDEMDSVMPPRANTPPSRALAFVNALLAELDGASDRGGVYVIGTTSHPELIDEAFLRPGRIIRES